MRRHAKASSAGSTSGQGSRLGSIRRGALATRASSSSSDGSGAPSHRSARLALALVFALTGFLALSATPVLAANIHPYESQITQANSISLHEPFGLAVDNNDNLWVFDQGSQLLSKFDSSGNYLAQNDGSGTWSGSIYVEALAYGKTADLLYAADSNRDDLWGIHASDASYAGVDFTDGVDTGCCYIKDAVDNSGTATDGDIYVTNGSRVTRVDGTGAAVDFSASASYISANQLTGTPAHSFAQASAVTTDALGDVYVGDTLNGEVDEFDSTGAFVRSFDGSGAPGGSINPAALVVDPTTGHLLVASGDAVDEFDSTGAYVTQITGSATPAGSLHNTAGQGIAVDSSGDVYVVDGDHKVVDRFGPRVVVPDVTTNPADPVGSTTATLNGHLDPAGGGNVTSCHFDYTPEANFQAHHFAGAQTASCAESTPMASPADVHADLTGLTPNTAYHFRLLTGNASGNNVGAEQSFTTPSAPTIHDVSCANVGKTTATFQGQVGPGTLDTTYHFEYGTDTSYGTSVPVSDADLGSGPADQPASQDLTGLQPGTTYHFRLVATNSLGTTRSSDQTCATLPAVQFGSIAAANLTPTSADLKARINPQGDDTAYHFEYGIDTSYGASVPASPVDIGSGSSDVAVSQHLTGLTPNTTYHFRLVATNSLGTTRSDDHTFVYDTSGGGLPDGRAYEVVSPTHKNGALLGDALFSLEPLVADAGDRVSVVSIQCFADAGSCNATGGGPIGSQYAFSRTPAGWQASALALSATQFPYGNTQLVDADTGDFIFTAAPTPGAAEHSYLRHADGSFAEIGPVTPPANGDLGANAFGSMVVSSDLSHIVWRVVEDDQRFPLDPVSGTFHGSVYEYAGTGNSQPLLVGVSGGPGSTDLISICNTSIGGDQAAQATVSSPDAGVIYFTAGTEIGGGPCPTGTGANAGTPVPANTLYARIDNDGPGAHTVPISLRSPGECTTPACTSSTPRSAEFAGAAADGSRAYFASTQQLTDDASQDDAASDDVSPNLGGCKGTIAANGCNLYLYDFSRSAGHELVDVSAGDSSGNGPRVRGVVGISRDGSHVYFVAQGVLTTDPNAQGQTAADGANNLYAYDANSGDLSFVVDLPDRDRETWSSSSFAYAGRKSNVTPDGRYLLFPSYARLTPDDSSTSGAGQLFRYDDQTGDLTRISIGENGFADNGNRSAPDTCATNRCSSDAIFITPIGYNPADRTDPSMSHDGSRIFFISPLALTPHALDQVQIGSDSGIPSYAENVYEWHAGHVSLISDGRDAAISQGGSTLPCGQFSAVCLLGASGSGDDVFFTTVNSLVPQDGDTALDIYDARVGGGIPYTPPPAGCQGDACKGAGTQAPAAQNPGSDVFSGPGNPPVKRKSHKKHHHKKRKHHRRSHKRANSNRGGQR